jgi:hypothetical protein
VENIEHGHATRGCTRKKEKIIRMSFFTSMVCTDLIRFIKWMHRVFVFNIAIGKAHGYFFIKGGSKINAWNQYAVTHS